MGKAEDRLRLLMVSDFFYPNFGGVENHIYQLSQCLISQGHHVVVMTHAYGDRTGVRFVTNGLKVYYIPRLPAYANATFPTLLGTFRILRNILIRERIDLVHGHQAFSVLANEAMLHARTMGYPVVFTDHSLFGFADAASIATNKLLKWTLCDVQAAICVSHTSKENTVLRACLPPRRVFVIPNAVDTSKFAPFPRPVVHKGKLTVVTLNRLVYRKGIDLQVAVIPALCARHADLHFIVAGDGPKRPLLESMIEEHRLHDRVRLVGSVQHEDARSLLSQGDVFMNTSLTEAFCMAIVEAASAGLLVVSTDVGGVPEVLPKRMRILAEPEPTSLFNAMQLAIEQVRNKPVDRQAQHEAVRDMYNWHQVALRTCTVYKQAMAAKCRHSLPTRFKRMLSCGRVFGLLAALFTAVDMLWYRVVSFLDPEDAIDICSDSSMPQLIDDG